MSLASDILNGTPQFSGGYAQTSNGPVSTGGITFAAPAGSTWPLVALAALALVLVLRK